jgi:hypothetical protein
LEVFLIPTLFGEKPHNKLAFNIVYDTTFQPGCHFIKTSKPCFPICVSKVGLYISRDEVFDTFLGVLWSEAVLERVSRSWRSSFG